VTETVIEVTDLTKIYAGRKVVASVTFSVESGSLFALLGPNGAGKTTTVEILEGYRRPDGGVVRVLGEDPHPGSANLKRKVGLMLQEGGVYPGIKVKEAIELFGAFYPDPMPAAEALEFAGLRPLAGRKVRRLSGGEKQRLNLALALIGRPDVLFLDEPTAGMDPHARAAAWEKIEQLKARGVTILLTTHFLDEAEHLAERVAIMDEGRLIEEGSLSSLLSSGDHFEFKTDRPIDVVLLSHHLSARVSSRSSMSYVVEVPATPTLVARTTEFVSSHDALITDLRTGRVSLESVFMKLTSPDQGDGP
jgi:ABC-2 type transport system ATP-binding protein